MEFTTYKTAKLLNIVFIKYMFTDENITQEMFPFLMEDDLKMLIPEMRERALFRKRVQEMAKPKATSAAASSNGTSTISTEGTVLAEAVSEARAAVNLAVQAIGLSPNKSATAFYYPYKYQ